MKRSHHPVLARRGWLRGERGSALPLALAFLVLFSVLTAAVLSFASTNISASSRLNAQRSDVYAVNGAVDAAIQRVRNNPAAGTAADAQGTLCSQAVSSANGNGLNNSNVQVTCVPSPDSGANLGSTSAPGFAMLSLAPFTTAAPDTWSGNTPPNCVNVPATGEIGIVQVQNSKQLVVTGNVYDNSDGDSDIWQNSCPQTSTASHIQVNGDVKQRASCHDIEPVDDSHLWLCGNQYGSTHATPQNNTHPDGPLAGAADVTLNDPGIADPASWAPVIATPPATQTTPTCPGTSVITFTPGTYTDASQLTALTTGACTNRVLWFQPGAYYFNFTNAGSHEWAINDGTTRIVGGQPNGVATQPVIVGPSTWNAGNFTGTGFTPGSGALSIDGTLATATANSNAARTITLTGYNNATPIPGNAINIVATLRVVHSEPANFGTRTVTVTPVGGPACAAQTVAQSATLTTTSIDVSGCLNAPTKISGGSGVSVQYSATCAGCTSSSQQAAQLDGIALDVTYTIPARPAWDGTPASVDATSPSVPGSCRHDGDAGWTDGVQFVFGGDSRVNLTAGRLELCDIPSTTHQEIVVYGVKSAGGGGGTQVGPTSWFAHAVAAGGTWTNTNNAMTENGQSATASLTSSTARTMTYTQLSPTTWPIPAGDQIPANATNIQATVTVTHNEGTTSSSRVNQPTINITPAGGSACGAQNLSRFGSMAQDTVTLPATCLNTPAKINGGVTAVFSVQRSSTNTVTENLDGITLKITYTLPSGGGGGGGGLNPESGCITQAPYYSPTTHAPDYNGACALLRIVGSTSTGQATCDTTHVCATFWGTVYAPSAPLYVQPDVVPVPVFNRGAAARLFFLGYNIQANALVPITTAPISTSIQLNRTVTFTATPKNPDGSAKSGPILTATVEFCDAKACTIPGTTHSVGVGGVAVQSWKVTR